MQGESDVDYLTDLGLWYEVVMAATCMAAGVLPDCSGAASTLVVCGNDLRVLM